MAPAYPHLHRPDGRTKPLNLKVITLVRKRFVLVDERTDSIDSLTRVLRLSGYVMLTGPAAADELMADAALTECWRMPTREHRARELLNGIALMSRCLSLKESTGH